MDATRGSPLIPGTTFHYRGVADGEPTTDTYVVTHQTTVVDGVTTTIYGHRSASAALVEEAHRGLVRAGRRRQCFVLRRGEAKLEAGPQSQPQRVVEQGRRRSAGVYMPGDPDVGQALPRSSSRARRRTGSSCCSPGCGCGRLGHLPTPMVTGEWTPLEPGSSARSGTRKASARPWRTTPRLARRRSAGEGHGP